MYCRQEAVSTNSTRVVLDTAHEVALVLFFDEDETMQSALAPTIAEMRSATATARAQGRSVGFVPTMGALHDGHASLIRVARERTGFVVVSIFVNPTQFGPSEDYAKYPRTLDSDREVAEKAGADCLFVPTAKEMYPTGSRAFVEVPLLDATLCGASRPGHFRGVCTIVLKLLNIVQPDVAIFGQKDAQQVRIIQQMVRDLNVPTTVQIVATHREADGLAMSSRNRYLSTSERAVAPGIHQALQRIRDRVHAGEGDVARLESALAADLLSIPGVRLDYASIVDDETLQPIRRLEKPALVAVAVFLGNTRLIDNVTLP